MKNRQRQKDTLFSILIFCSAFAVNLLIQKLFTTQTLVPMIFVFGVFLISLKTHGYCYGITSAIVSVFAVNFAFTYPYYAFDFFVEESILSAVIMLAVAVSTSTLNIRIRDQEKLRSENEKERMRGNLLRAISHDLRTPLTSILGNADSLISNFDALDEGMRKQIFSDIYEDAGWLIELVENLLALTKIEDGSVKLQLSDQVVEDVVREALRHVERRKNEHEITVDCGEDVLLARMDAKLIVQVLVNLINNAVKYTQAGSKIRITAGKEEKNVWIAVEDNGPGIPAECREHVFEMFYSGKNKVSDSRRSLGLGLALCRSIVNAHGGELVLRDCAPHGCHFRFTLPLSEVNLNE